MKTPNTLLRIFASLTLVTMAAISAYLTYGFCYEIGSLIHASMMIAIIDLMDRNLKDFYPLSTGQDKTSF